MNTKKKIRVVIDMQGAQSTANGRRGIGRYVLALARAMAAQAMERDLVLALNGAFPDSVSNLRAEFKDLLPPDAIQVWVPPQDCSGLHQANDARRVAGEALYEAFLGSLRADVVLVSSLFEGLIDDTVTSVGKGVHHHRTAVILYDLIPLIHRHIYLTDQKVSRWYWQKLDHLRRADLLLAISSSSGQEAVDHCGFPSSQVVSIGTACDAHFKPQRLTLEERQRLTQRYGLDKPFVMYTGGIDHRKNIEGLIRAFAMLPKPLRQAHQLAVVCSAHDADRQRLLDLAGQHGLDEGQLVMTGFVPEKDLVALYNACSLFVFPSWHEGFGLPALEAMACGRPTIASNTSSLPEVIGRDDAMFDPRDDKAIAAGMAKGLGDPAFRRALEQHAPKQAAKFSWQHSAKLAWDAIENLTSQPQSRSASVRPKLAFVSPLPPAKSGIADYSAELLPELARHYDIDVVVQQASPVQDAWVIANTPIRTVDWFRANRHRYDRVIYHFGNSDFHGHMFELLEEIPGMVVLHDFFLSGVVAHRDVVTLEAPGAWPQALLTSHGWSAVQFRYEAKDSADVVWKYPCSLDVLQAANGVIVHAEHSRDLARDWYGPNAASDWAIIPHLRIPTNYHHAQEFQKQRRMARQQLGIAADEFVVCSFGHLGRSKLNDRLLVAWQSSPMATDGRCQLVFVGENEGGQFGQTLLQRIQAMPSSRVRITGYAPTESYRLWLTAADVAVQLRTHSRGETSGAVLDCWNHGLPTVVNAHGGLADLPDDAVLKLPDAFCDEALTKSLIQLWQNPKDRERLSKRGLERIWTDHRPRSCADRYRDAIESAYSRANLGVAGVMSALSRGQVDTSAAEVASVAEALAANFPPGIRPQQWLLDCSLLAAYDDKTGIQRVVRNLLVELLARPPSGVQIEPVLSIRGQEGYRYARKFTCRLLGIPDDWAVDEPVEAWSGDVFLALDLNPHGLPEQATWLQRLRGRGVQVFAVVYDLLPLRLPSAFVQGAAEGHQRWLESVVQMDGALCISRAVAAELRSWLDAHGPKTHTRPFAIHAFHLGADLDGDLAAGPVLDTAKAPQSNTKRFLMVGTIEPRKGHALVLDAFDELWGKGTKASLTIVGKQGWMVEELIERINRHPKLHRRLHWFSKADDAALTALYRDSDCVVVASEGEGFGLPLIEAAAHGSPILARDIPVFREVAGDHAAYFPAEASVQALTDAIQAWLTDFDRGASPQSGGMPRLTWGQSAEEVKRILLSKVDAVHAWQSTSTVTFLGNDVRMHSQVGLPRGFDMETTGEAGYLIFGPYKPFRAGSYDLRIHATVTHMSGKEVFDIAADGGKTLLLCQDLKSATPGITTWHLKMNLETDVEDMELRLFVASESKLKLHRIEIKPTH